MMMQSIGRMAIVTKCKVISLVLVTVTVATLAVTFTFGNQIRIGGPLHAQERDYADLVADILPPPEYVIEPWLEATLIAGGEDDPAAHLERLVQLRKDYEDRKTYWAGKALPQLLAQDMAEANRQADAFWQAIDANFVPVVRSGDRAQIRLAHQRLRPIYAAHRAAIDRLVTDARAATDQLSGDSHRLFVLAIILIGGLAATLMATMIAGVLLLLRQGVAPLSRTADLIGAGLDRLARGDIGHRIEQPLPGEYEALRTAFNATATAFAEMLQSVTGAAGALSAGSEEIREAATSLSTRTEHEAHALGEAAHGMGEVTQLAATAQQGIERVNSAMQSAHDEAAEARTIVHSSIAAIERVEHSFGEIAQITRVIDGIAFQTNLLALNAGVEAARAGEAGKGFAVVANEVRELAQRTADAARQIGQLVAVSGDHVASGVQQVASSEASFRSIVAKVDEVSAMLADVVDVTRRQSGRVSEVTGQVDRIDALTRQNSAMAEQCSAAAGALAEQSQRLAGIVAKFKGAAVGVPASPGQAVRAQKQSVAEATSDRAVLREAA